uniref:ADAM metallopeptidase domain 28 n=1 Tax=Mastacembelus armatus TaxID=205130 RepID=A0A7N8YBK8_9TELE
MQLEKNYELLTKDYTETYYQDDGTRVTTTPDDIDHCYYHGRIVNDSGSSVSISTCDGLRGYFRTSAQRYLIEPLSGSDEGDHAVMTFDEKNYTPAVCGVTNTSWSDDFEPPTSRSRSRSGYIKMKQDQTMLRKKIFEIVNFVNLVYKPLRTFIALVGLEIWSNGDLITVTPPAGANLDAFMKWRNSDLVKRIKHDNAHLISAIDFEGPTVGLAYIGTFCSGHSVGVIQDHNDRAIAVGATLAHEMGHNLGMDHDDSSACVCSAESCIMAAALSWIIPWTFSSCSSSNYEKYLTARSPSCILDKPDYRSLITPSVCGNGFVETGEQCDCGTVEDCSNPCCNATTCTLSEGSECADGECCESCKILPHSRECRRKQDECDLAEYCDGKRATCPEDVFAVNGIPCKGDLGYCYNGQCPERPNQCVKLYGSSATEARPTCYDQNLRGTYYAFCTRPANDKYIPCQKGDMFCGKLFCQGGNENPNYGRMVRFGDCKAAFFEDFTKDFGQVDTGTKCGDGKVCSENQCMDLETAYRNINCSAKCSGHGVCNHKNKCQCEPGWMPPNCDSQDTTFTHLSNGTWSLETYKYEIQNMCAFFTASLKFQIAHPKPRGAPPPPPPAGNRLKPTNQNYVAARQVTSMPLNTLYAYYLENIRANVFVCMTS